MRHTYKPLQQHARTYTRRYTCTRAHIHTNSHTYTHTYTRAGKGEFLEELLASPDPLSPETVLAIRSFLRNKRFQRARGSVRVHIVFALKLRSKRAVRRVKLVLGVMRVVNRAFLRPLRRIRTRRAACVLQSYVRTQALAMEWNQKTQAVCMALTRVLVYRTYIINSMSSNRLIW